MDRKDLSVSDPLKDSQASRRNGVSGRRYYQYEEDGKEKIVLDKMDGL